MRTRPSLKAKAHDFALTALSRPPDSRHGTASLRADASVGSGRSHGRSSCSANSDPYRRDQGLTTNVAEVRARPRPPEHTLPPARFPSTRYAAEEHGNLLTGASYVGRANGNRLAVRARSRFLRGYVSFAPFLNIGVLRVTIGRPFPE